VSEVGVRATRRTTTSAAGRDNLQHHRTGWLRTLALFSLVAAPGVVFGQGQLNLSFQTVAGGVMLSGSGSESATLAFGDVSSLGPLVAGVTRTTDATSFTVSSPVGVRVTKNGLPRSTSYTLRARVTSSTVPLGLRVNGLTLTTSYQDITSALSYAVTYPQTIGLYVPLSYSGGPVSAPIEFLAISN
jgi:hypothetical protein